MSKSYFEVDEEVILCSKNQPGLNGQATVLGVYETNILAVEFCRNKNPRALFDPSSQPHEVSYELTIPCISKKGNVVLWAESALRKKHKPGKSFTEIMESLDSPVKS